MNKLKTNIFKVLILIVFLCLSIHIYVNREDYLQKYEVWKLEMMPDPMANNYYNRGQCTFYVFEELKKRDLMIEKSWGDAKFWADKAKEDGYRVDSKPSVNGLLQSTGGKQGHVAVIEEKYKNGAILVSEMNYVEPYKVTKRIIKDNEQKQYNYIHPKKNPKAKLKKINKSNISVNSLKYNSN